MKKKFYTWEECIQLREIKVLGTYLVTSWFLELYNTYLELEETEPSKYRQTERGINCARTIKFWYQALMYSKCLGYSWERWALFRVWVHGGQSLRTNEVERSTLSRVSY